MLRASVAIAVVSALTASASIVDAAPRAVRGVVVARDGGRPIAGATVLTERGDVAVTELDGAFALTIDDEVNRELTIAAPGYISRTIDLAAIAAPDPSAGSTNTSATGSGSSDAANAERAPIVLRVELETVRGGETIEVTGKAPEETKPLSYHLTADEIRFMPGAANDILRAAQALPGVSRIPFSFGGLVLRGASPRDTTVYLDGIEVPLAFHFGGLTSFYPGTMLSTLAVTSGGFDAAYGRAQGGLVALTTREPRTDVWRAGGSLGLLDSSVFAEGPIGDGGIIVGVRHSYLDKIMGPFVDDDVPLPSYWDLQVRTSFGDPRRHGRITPMLFGSLDRVVNEDVSITSLFLRAAVPYTRAWGPVSLRIVPWAGWTHLQFAEHRGGRGSVQDSIARPSFPSGVRSELVRDYAWGHMRGGLDVDAGYLSQARVDIAGNEQMLGQTLAWLDVAGWTETRVRIDGDRFAVKPGLRVDYYGISEELVVDPRINIHQRLSDTFVLRQALGRYHQPPIPADVDRSDGNPALDSSYMDQASLGVDAELSATWLASVTAFAGYGHDIGVPVQHGNEAVSPNLGGLGPTFQLLLEKQLGLPAYRENLGRARQTGIELLVKHSSPRWFLLFAYTLSWAQRTDGPEGDGWRPFELDQRHNLNVAASRALGRWRFGARVQLVSGNPYSPTISFTEVAPVKDPFGGQLPTFFHLNVRADRRWHRAWGDINLYLDIQNVTNRRNVEGKDVWQDDAHPLGYDKDVPGLPIVPFIGVEWVPR